MEVTLKLLSVVHQAVEVHLGFIAKHLVSVLNNEAGFNYAFDKAGELAKIIFHIFSFCLGQMYIIYFTLHKRRKQKSGETSPPICYNKTKIKKTLVHFFLAVLAAALNAAAVGAPFAPGFLIFSPLPASIRFRLALRFA